MSHTLSVAMDLAEQSLKTNFLLESLSANVQQLDDLFAGRMPVRPKRLLNAPINNHVDNIVGESQVVEDVPLPPPPPRNLTVFSLYFLDLHSSTLHIGPQCNVVLAPWAPFVTDATAPTRRVSQA